LDWYNSVKWLSSHTRNFTIYSLLPLLAARVQVACRNYNAPRDSIYRTTSGTRSASTDEQKSGWLVMPFFWKYFDKTDAVGETLIMWSYEKEREREKGRRKERNKKGWEQRNKQGNKEWKQRM
jgi:hypothetical protein